MARHLFGSFQSNRCLLFGIVDVILRQVFLLYPCRAFLFSIFLSNIFLSLFPALEPSVSIVSDD